MAAPLPAVAVMTATAPHRGRPAAATPCPQLSAPLTMAACAVAVVALPPFNYRHRRDYPATGRPHQRTAAADHQAGPVVAGGE